MNDPPNSPKDPCPFAALLRRPTRLDRSTSLEDQQTDEELFFA